MTTLGLTTETTPMSVRKVTKRGKKKYRVRYVRKDAGGKVIEDKSFFFDKESDANKKNAELQLGIGPAEKPQIKKGVPTLSEFVESFMREYKNEVGEQTYERMGYTIDKHIAPALGDKRLDQIGRDEIAMLLAKMAETVSLPTAKTNLNQLSRILTKAEEQGIIERVPRMPRVRKVKVGFRYLSEDEARRLIAATTDTWRLFVVIAIRLGLRRGEIQGLWWGDFDLRAGKLHVQRQWLARKSRYDPPKGGKTRTLDIPPDVVTLLKSHRPPGAARNAVVFPGQRGRPVPAARITEVLCEACDKAEVERVTARDLRHTFASWHAAHTPLPVLQQWMGHEKIETTMIYAHFSKRGTEAYAVSWADQDGGTAGGTADEDIGADDD